MHPLDRDGVFVDSSQILLWDFVWPVENIRISTGGCCEVKPAIRLCYLGVSPQDPQIAYLGRFLKLNSGTYLGNCTVHSTVPILRNLYRTLQYIIPNSLFGEIFETLFGNLFGEPYSTQYSRTQYSTSAVD
jgi:hypothetical protein